MYSFLSAKTHHIHPVGILNHTDLCAVGFLRRTFWNVTFRLLLVWSSIDRILTILFISLSKTTAPDICKNKFLKFCYHYKDFSQLYTNGSRMVNQVAAVVVYKSSTKTNRLPNTASIFSAELYTISLALAVSRHTKDNNFLMFISYFMSSLQA